MNKEVKHNPMEWEVDKYNCRRCRDEWSFSPEDYHYKKKLYPTVCPLCEIPITQMVKDVYAVEGLLGVVKRLWIRATR